jgi:hypothetical protein
MYAEFMGCLNSGSWRRSIKALSQFGKFSKIQRHREETKSEISASRGCADGLGGEAPAIAAPGKPSKSIENCGGGQRWRRLRSNGADDPGRDPGNDLMQQPMVVPLKGRRLRRRSADVHEISRAARSTTNGFPTRPG